MSLDCISLQGMSNRKLHVLEKRCCRSHCCGTSSSKLHRFETTLLGRQAASFMPGTSKQRCSDMKRQISYFRKTRATIEVALYFWKGVSTTERLDPKSSEIGHCSFCIILVVYLDHGVFHPVAVMFLSKPVFGLRRVLSS